jgi:glycosyltransferase involved in cell wall biosynthesis
VKVLLFEQPFGQSLSAIHAYELWHELRELGVEATFLTEEPQLPEAVARITPHLAGLPPRLAWASPGSVYRHFHFRARKLQPLRSLATLRQIQKQDKGLLRRAQLYPKPDLVYRRHNYLIAECEYARSIGVPSVCEVNGIIQDEAAMAWWATSLSNKIVAKWEGYSLGWHSHYITVTEQLAQMLVTRFHVPEKKITTILNGVNTARFTATEINAAKDQLGLNRSTPYVLFSGSLSPWQGVEYAIKAMPIVRHRYTDATLLILGSGIEHDRLQALAASQSPNNTTKFLGQVPHSKVPLYISASSVCVLPRTRNYNDSIGISPLKLCEYLSCARPVVASDIRGLEFLHHEECGTLVKPESPEDLALAIIDHLGNKKRSIWMGQNGRYYVTKNRSWKLAAEKTMAVLEETIKEDMCQKT